MNAELRVCAGTHDGPGPYVCLQDLTRHLDEMGYHDLATWLVGVCDGAEGALEDYRQKEVAKS